MIDAYAVRRDFQVIQTDLTDQRLFPFMFTPGADDLHNHIVEQG
jgi:hypothetical protein